MRTIDVLKARGYTQGEGADPEGDWTKTLGDCNVEVRTHEERWCSQEKRYYWAPLVEPKIRVYLPHSCDEWVVADSADQMTEFAESAEQAHREVVTLVANLSGVTS